MKDTIANSSLEHAQSLDMIFSDDFLEEFNSFVHERVDLAGEYMVDGTPGTIETAARKAAAAFPSEPKSDTTQPCGYCRDVIDAAGEFLNARVNRCRELFVQCEAGIKGLCERIKARVDNQLGAKSVLQKSIDELGRLKGDVDGYGEERERTEKEKGKYHGCLGLFHRWSDRLDSIGFMVVLISILAIEFSFVWYLLSGQLGIGDTIFATILAVGMVVVCALFTSLSLVAFFNRRYQKLSTTLPIIWVMLSLALFIFCMGILSAYRGDALDFGFGAVIEGYRSMVIPDIGLAFLVNLLGYVVMAFEFGRVLWHNNASCFKGCADSVREIEKEKKRINRVMKAHKEALTQHEKSVPQLRNDCDGDLDALKAQFAAMRGLADNCSIRADAAAKTLQGSVCGIMRRFIDENRKWRTQENGLCPAPAWFDAEITQFVRIGDDSLSNDVAEFSAKCQALESEVRECQDACRKAVAEYEKREDESIAQCGELLADVESGLKS